MSLQRPRQLPSLLSSSADGRSPGPPVELQRTRRRGCGHVAVGAGGWLADARVSHAHAFALRIPVGVGVEAWAVRITTTASNAAPRSPRNICFSSPWYTAPI